MNYRVQQKIIVHLADSSILLDWSVEMQNAPYSNRGTFHFKLK